MDQEERIDALEQAMRHALGESDAARRRAQSEEAERWEAEARVLAAHLTELLSTKRSSDGRPKRSPDDDQGTRPPGKP